MYRKLAHTPPKQRKPKENKKENSGFKKKNGLPKKFLRFSFAKFPSYR
jgi:hypothetical protein